MSDTGELLVMAAVWALIAAVLIDAQMRGLYNDSEWRSALLRLV